MNKEMIRRISLKMLPRKKWKLLHYFNYYWSLLILVFGIILNMTNADLKMKKKKEKLNINNDKINNYCN